MRFTSRVLGLVASISLFLLLALVPVSVYGQEEGVGIKDKVDIKITRASSFPTTTVITSVVAVIVVVGGSVFLIRRQRKGSG